MNSSYWNAQYNYLMANRPPKPESYYNQSFEDKIKEARQNIDNLVPERDKSWAATAQKQDEYDTFYGSMKEYGDVYKNAESEFGVKEAQDTYEKSKKALALAESTLSALPSSINSGSNRVLTQSQREARYNVLADKAVSYKNNLLARSSAYEEVWKKARQSQAEYAKAEIASQYSKLSDYNNAFTNAMNEYMSAQSRLTRGETELRNWQSQYRTWQFQKWSTANTIWYQNMSNALNRYIEALNTEMVQRQAQSAIDIAYARAATQSAIEQSATRRANNTIDAMNRRKEAETANSLGILGRYAYLTSR